MDLRTTTHPGLLGFRLDCARDARSVSEARRRSQEQGVAERLNGLLDAFEAMSGAVLACDGRPHVDLNEQPGLVAVTDLIWKERFGRISEDASLEGFVAAPEGKVKEAELVLAGRELFQMSSDGMRIYSPQDDQVYLLSPSASSVTGCTAFTVEPRRSSP